jgi:hypothetical protein
LTGEELLEAIDAAAPKLSEASLRLLLRLVSLALQSGSGQIHMSQRKLAELAGMSREGIARAVRGLSDIIDVDNRNTTLTTFRLPDHWFTPQPTLFPVPAGQPGRPTGQLARPALAYPPGQLANLPGQVTGLRTRPIGQLTRPPLAYEIGQLANEPGQTGLPNRPVETENQQLSADALIRSDQDLILERSGTISQISQIAEIRELQEEQKEVASLLSLDLQEYMKRHHPPGSCEAFPAELILARCLAIAPHEDLQDQLRILDGEGRTCGRKYAWFVTVFLNRIYGIDPQVASEAFEASRHRKKVKPELEPLFAEEIVQTVTTKARKLG